MQNNPSFELDYFYLNQLKNKILVKEELADSDVLVANLAALYTTPCWSHIVAEELRETDVRAGVAVGFPYGTNTSKAQNS